jgi:hypothetical protein
VIVAFAAATLMHGNATAPAVEVEMRNVDLHLTTDIALHIRSLRGRFVPNGTRQAPYLDDPRSYSVTVDNGEVAVDLASLNALMTRALIGHSNLRSIQISTGADGSLRQQGTVKKGIPVPFDVKGIVSPTSDGRIRIHTVSVKGFGLPVSPLLKTFGVKVDDLFKVDPGRGISIDGNDVLLDPSSLLPPPVMHGRITAVRVEKDALLQVFGTGAPRALSPPATSKNYIYWRGGQLSFGKLTMTETDLELVDDDPGDPFDFSIDRWNDQLIGGYSKITPERGLKQHMPDYNDLARHSAHSNRHERRPARSEQPHH